MTATIDKEYENLNKRMGELFSDGTLMEFTEAEEIAKVVYEAATDNKDQLRYLAGNDAHKIHKQRLDLGNERFRQNVTELLNLKSPYNKS